MSMKKYGEVSFQLKSKYISEKAAFKLCSIVPEVRPMGLLLRRTRCPIALNSVCSCNQIPRKPVNVNIDVITVFSNNESIRGGIDIPYLNASNHKQPLSFLPRRQQGQLVQWLRRWNFRSDGGSSNLNVSKFFYF